ncbi:methionine ABC transporter ATP-binding protein [Faecalibaculum rodentium]|uniref:Methionine ABC transporter ATP-binding protein n=4 Tax=Faecalibaculum rodentium TaxID=1702221 RepID=A0A1Q9YLL7_9FIRM|nr:ATP-binding cassette domain-containing protein [Faecalibaculum rodentium]OLU45856.1 methionine ABC transporter ATP-binding protein [Faecalibaculum rodentium]
MIRLEHVTKTFQTRDGDVHAVKDVSLDIAEGQIFGIIGFSGAGKSTLVRCMNLLERPEEGKVIFDGKNLLDLDAAGLRHARQKMSMIFQHFNLMRSRTVYENIALPLRMEKRPKEEIDKKVMELLDLIDLVERRDSYPSQLSGGQKQRVAIARALATDPKVLLCDEATSALDPQTTQSILHLIRRINRERNITVVVITHEMLVVKEICDRVAVMEAGRVVETNDLVPIFINPIEEITRNFINTTNESAKIQELLDTGHPLTQLAENQQLVRLTYTPENAAEPIISRLAEKLGVESSIIFGNIEVIRDEPIGTIVTKMTGSDQQLKDALALCREADIRTEVMKRGNID